MKGKIRTLALRKPGWAKEDLEICVQGNQADPIVDESGYIRIQADFEAGVEINVRFPYHPGLIRTPDKPELAAVQAGPYILAALSEEQEAKKEWNISLEISVLFHFTVSIRKDTMCICIRRNRILMAKENR